jgi:uncharacterized membrane protein YtjA (UPF0391 family)
MMQASVVFLVAGLVALVMGLQGWAGLSFEVGRIVMCILLALSILTFLVSLWSSRHRLI